MGDGAAEQDIPFAEQHADGSLSHGPLSLLLDLSIKYPLFSVLAVLAVLWALGKLSVSKTGTTLGGETSKDEALARARQIQQERIERAAAARAAANESVAARQNTPTPKASQPDSSSAKAPAPTAPAASIVRSANDPKSVAARLAKIQKGKGPSDHNPLQGFGGSSSSASSVVCRRKGG